jgi:thiol-disulfide isomerase/thioredoxin
VATIVLAFVIAIRMWLKTTVTDDKFDDVANSNERDKEATVYFFHVDWCPHCKTALPEWAGFSTSFHNKVINGYTIKCKEVDCTEPVSTDKTALMNRFGVESYPTIKMVRDTTVIDFESRVTTSALSSFVNTMLDK